MKCILKVFYVTILFFSISGFAKAQVLNDAGTMKLIQNSLDHIYNYEFDEADVIINQVEKNTLTILSRIFWVLLFTSGNICLLRTIL